MTKTIALTVALLPSGGGAELARSVIVIGCALAAILAGPVLPL